MMRAPRTALWCTLWLALCAPRAAGADAATETRFFDELARQAYEHEKYDVALLDFLQADAVTPSARSLYNIAVCAELARRRELAFAYFEQYLAGPDQDAERRSDAERRRSELGAQLALVHVVTDPPGALVYVDRTDLGASGQAPRTLPLEPGTHSVEVRLADHRIAQATAVAVHGKTVEVVLQLPPITGGLEVTAEPGDAHVDISRAGKPVLAPPAGQPAQLPIGRYRIHVAAPGFAPAETDAVVREGETTRITLAATPLPKPLGRLLLGTSGVAARVVVDKKPRAVSPARIDDLPVGRHEVQLWADGFRPWRGVVQIRDRKTTFLDVTLEPIRR